MQAKHIALIIIVGIAFGVFGFYVGKFIGNWANQDDRQEQAQQEQAKVPEKPKLAETLPDFSFINLDGETVTLADYEGKALFVNFWATWCAPCRKEIPLLVDMQEKYADKDIVVLGVAIDNEKSIRKFIEQIGGVNYPILFAEQEIESMEWAQRDVGIELIGLPISVTTDTEGRILSVHEGEVDESEALALFEEMVNSSKTQE